MDNSKLSKIILITGQQNSGKSTLCKNIVDHFSKSGIKISGILSELEKEDDKLSAIYAIDIQTNEKILLAQYFPGWDKNKPERKWKFHKNVFEWGNSVLKKSVPTDLLIIDELGYIEFEEKKGWTQSFMILNGNCYKCAIIVVRPECVDLAKKIFNIKYQINIDNVYHVKKVKIQLVIKIESILKS